MTEGVKIDVDCALGHVCSIGAGAAPGAANIGDHVYISPHSCILGPVAIGDGATIPASSLVLSDAPAGHTAIGMPARVLPRFKVQTFRAGNILTPSSNEGPRAVSAQGDDLSGRPSRT